MAQPVTLQPLNATLRQVLESSCRVCEHFDEFRPIPKNPRAPAVRCDFYAKCKANRPLGTYPPLFERCRK